MPDQALLWGGFGVFVLVMLGLDLGVFHRKAHVVDPKEALLWSAAWVGLALLFALGIYVWRGAQTGLEFLTGYLIEKSLSVDNVFVFLAVFSALRVPALYQHKVLFWGIVGALVMRGILIALVVTLIQQFHWVIYVFGALLLLTGARLMTERGGGHHPERSPALKLLRRFLPVTEDYDGGRFFARRDGRVFVTPLLAALVLIEVTDLVFAVDSIPAVLAITPDPFIVWTSNVFAVLGLRALYFALAGVMRLFSYLRYGLAAILVFVGGKMLLTDVYKVPVGLALGAVAAILAASIAASLAWPPRAGEGSDDATTDGSEVIPR